FICTARVSIITCCHISSLLLFHLSHHRSARTIPHISACQDPCQLPRTTHFLGHSHGDTHNRLRPAQSQLCGPSRSHPSPSTLPHPASGQSASLRQRASLCARRCPPATGRPVLPDTRPLPANSPPSAPAEP